MVDDLVWETEWGVKRLFDGRVLSDRWTRKQAELIIQSERDHRDPIECVLVSRRVARTEWTEAKP